MLHFSNLSALKKGENNTDRVDFRNPFIKQNKNQEHETSKFSFKKKKVEDCHCDNFYMVIPPLTSLPTNFFLKKINKNKNKIIKCFFSRLSQGLSY